MIGALVVSKVNGDTHTTWMSNESCTPLLHHPGSDSHLQFQVEL